MTKPRCVRKPRVLRTALGGLFACAVACVGGQTGTEAQGGEACGGSGPTTPVLVENGQCQPSEPALAPADDSVLGFSAEQTVTVVNQSPAWLLTWSTGETSTIALKVALGGGICLTQTDAGAALKAMVLVSLRSDDGRVDSTLPGSLLAHGVPGSGLVSIELEANLTCTAGDASSWTRDCGLGGVDPIGYSGLGLQLSARWQFTGGAKTLGTVWLLGGKTPTCPPGQATPCTVTEWIPLLVGSFGIQ